VCFQQHPRFVPASSSVAAVYDRRFSPLNVGAKRRTPQACAFGRFLNVFNNILALFRQ
jgi:hypothetical protein